MLPLLHTGLQLLFGGTGDEGMGSYSGMGSYTRVHAYSNEYDMLKMAFKLISIHFVSRHIKGVNIDNVSRNFKTKII